MNIDAVMDPDEDVVELDRDHAVFIQAYVDELRAAFAEVEPWWAQLEARHTRRALALRWPAGPASHPRVLSVYREHQRQLRALSSPARPGPVPRFDDDSAWGSEVELPPQRLIPPAPRRLLVDRLQVAAPSLYAKLVYLVLPPTGEGIETAPTTPAWIAPQMGQLAPVGPRPDGPRSFDWEAGHGVDRGLRRLLGAGIDLRPSGAGLGTVARADASELHRLAFDAYARDLERALAGAQRWWAGQIAGVLRADLDPDQARARVRATYPVGPASHAGVVTVVQGYWALCHEINAALADRARRVAPELMLLAWLRDGRHDSWVEALTAWPYWPVGRDAAGRWS